MQFELLVAWVTLALINANLAQAKGYRGLSSFVLSLVFFGPLVTLVIAIASRKESTAIGLPPVKREEPLEGS